MIRTFLAIGLTIRLINSPALAETPAPTTTTSPSSAATTTCFDVVPLAAEAPPHGPILVDRCTGHTWLLLRVNLEKNGKTFTYRWLPLSLENGEPVLQFGLPQ